MYDNRLELAGSAVFARVLILVLGWFVLPLLVLSWPCVCMSSSTCLYDNRLELAGSAVFARVLILVLGWFALPLLVLSWPCVCMSSSTCLNDNRLELAVPAKLPLSYVLAFLGLLLQLHLLVV